MLGQFLGDFVKGSVEESDFPEGVKEGIRAHRRVDASGDRHEFIRLAKSFVPSHQKRYVGIVLDIYSDHLLIRLWEDIMDSPFQDVLHAIHDLLRVPPVPLPPAAARTASALLDYRILESYADADNLPRIVNRIGTRLRKPVELSPVLVHLLRHEHQFLDAFPRYFEDMRKAAAM
jgi:acyl carrier protein phosphodiesterase